MEIISLSIAIAIVIAASYWRFKVTRDHYNEVKKIKETAVSEEKPLPKKRGRKPKKSALSKSSEKQQ